MRRVLGPLLALGFGLAVAGFGLEVETGLVVERSSVEVVAGPPGTPAQEVAFDRGRFEATASHRQHLGAGWTAEGSLVAWDDTRPQGTGARLLEGWLAWEPLPGTLALGAGKRLVSPSSGFSHKPLDWLAWSDDREGRWGGQAAWFGEGWSASVFGSPSLAQGRVGASWEQTDVQVLGLVRDGRFRGGVGADTSWGDHLTFRVEAAADAGTATRPDGLAGLTWTGDDKTTVMVEGTWDGRGQRPVRTTFVRLASDLDDRVSAELWTQVDLAAWAHPRDLDGWVGTGLKGTAGKWSLEGKALGALRSPATAAGTLRWKTSVEAKVAW